MLSTGSVISKLSKVSLYEQSEEKKGYFKPIDSINQFLSQSTDLGDCKDRQAALEILLEDIQGIASNYSTTTGFDTRAKNHGGRDVEAVKEYFTSLKNDKNLIEGLNKLKTNTNPRLFSTSDVNTIDDLKIDIKNYTNVELDSSSKDEKSHPSNTINNLNTPGFPTIKPVNTPLVKSKKIDNNDFDKQAFNSYVKGKVPICYPEAHKYNPSSDKKEAIEKELNFAASGDLISRCHLPEINGKTWSLRRSIKFPQLLIVTYLHENDGLITAKEAYLAFIKDNKTDRHYWKFVEDPENYSPEKHQTIEINKKIRFNDMKVISQLLKEALGQVFRIDEFFAPESEKVRICYFKDYKVVGEFIKTQTKLKDKKTWLFRKSTIETGAYTLSYLNDGNVRHLRVAYISEKKENDTNQYRWVFLGEGSTLPAGSELCLKQQIYKADIEEIVNLYNIKKKAGNEKASNEKAGNENKYFLDIDELYIPDKGSEFAWRKDYNKDNFANYMEGKKPVCASMPDFTEISKDSKTWFLMKHPLLQNMLVIVEISDNKLESKISIACMKKSKKWEVCDKSTIGDIITNSNIIQKGRLDFDDMSAMVSRVHYCLGRELRLDQFYAPRENDSIAAKDYKVFGAD